MTRARALLAAGAAAALVAGACGPEFVPGSALTDLRVLAVVPDPPAVARDEPVTVRATTFAPAGDPVVAETWSFCPLTAGAASGYRCVAPACERPLQPDASGGVTAVPSALALECLAALGGSLPDAPGRPFPDEVETVFRYTARSAAGRERAAVARVTLHVSGAPADRNLAPVIARVEIAGAPAQPGAVAAAGRPGEAVPIVAFVDPASIQRYVDASGREIAESVVVSFYASAGRFPDGEDRAGAPVAAVELELRELRPEDGEALVWAVARDLRGGQAVAGPFRVAITR